VTERPGEQRQARDTDGAQTAQHLLADRVIVDDRRDVLVGLDEERRLERL